MVSIPSCPKCDTSDWVRLHKEYDIKNQKKKRKQFYCKKCDCYFAETATRNNGVEYRSRYEWEKKKKAFFLWEEDKKIIEVAEQMKVPRKTIYRWFWNMCRDRKKIEKIKDELYLKDYADTAIEEAIKRFVKRFGKRKKKGRV